jgi:hypothetical protein
VLADQAAAAEGGDERDAGHDRRQHERDEDESTHHTAAAEVDAREQPRQGSAEQDARRDGEQAAHRRDDQRLPYDVGAEVVGQGAPRGAQDERDQWHHEHGDADARGDEEDGRRAAEAGAGHWPSPKMRGASKPASRRTACPSGLWTSSTKSDARADPSSGATS